MKLNDSQGKSPKAAPAYSNYSRPGEAYDPLAHQPQPGPAIRGADKTGKSSIGQDTPAGGKAVALPRRDKARRDVGQKAERAGRPAQWVIAVCLVVLVGLLLWMLYSAASGISGLFSPGAYYTTPPSGTFSVVSVVGTIQSSANDAYTTNASSYQHSDTVSHIKALAENDGNTGILLYMNTGGGGVYESDEVYLALMDYKEKTGRPVWAYMANTCASGGYYICAAADHITANRNTTTGSIGVYIALTDTSGLYEKLGIESVLVRSGDNKGVGTSGVPITEEQRAVYQSVVDEAYEQFIALVAEGREMPLDTVRQLADGRIYTGLQAHDLGLVDEITDWDTVLEAFKEETGAEPFYPSFNRQSRIAKLIGGIFSELPKSDAEAMLDAAEALPSGVPMALYDPALG
ncbi:signal peptide peptidase SppA [Ruminococcaceae bacterium OttesenSCG-928-D13]|nr:signal peptide peptidase SppA [Ruminococcaceae bacterium OttesenSCG-928-D13]